MTANFNIVHDRYSDHEAEEFLKYIVAKLSADIQQLY